MLTFPASFASLSSLNGCTLTASTHARQTGVSKNTTWYLTCKRWRLKQQNNVSYWVYHYIMHAATPFCSLFYSIYWTYGNISVFSHFIISLSIRVFLHHGRPPIHACVCISVCGHVSCCAHVHMRVCVCVWWRVLDSVSTCSSKVHAYKPHYNQPRVSIHLGPHNRPRDKW